MTRAVVSLGEVVSHRKEFITIDDTAQYKRCRVQLHAKGIVERDCVPGAMIKTKEQQLCRANELLVAEIDAKVGGFGIVPSGLEGAIVSSHYFLFTPDITRIDPAFLGYYVRTPAFRDQVNARGSTNYAAIRPHHVLEYQIPLPPLAEQRRIVAKIERLAAKIEEARGIRNRSGSEAELVLSAGSREVFRESIWPRRSIDDVVGRSRLANGKSVKSGESPDQIRCLRLSAMRNGRLDFSDTKPVPLNASEASPYAVASGDVFVLRGNGSKDLVGRAAMAIGSEYGVIFPDLFIRVPLQGTGVLPEFFVAYWNSPQVRDFVITNATTTSGIWKINQGHIASVELALPPIQEQHRIIAYLDGLQAKVDRLKALQAQIRAELDALLPSILDRAFKGEL